MSYRMRERISQKDIGFSEFIDNLNLYLGQYALCKIDLAEKTLLLKITDGHHETFLRF